MRRRALAVHHHVDVRPRRRGHLPSLHQQLDHTLHAHRESDGRGRLAAELRDQAVVTAAGAYGILRAEDSLIHSNTVRL